MIRHPYFIAIILILQYFQAISQEVVVHSLPCSGKFNDFAPVVYDGGILFCSDRPSSYGIVWTDESDRFETGHYLFKDGRVIPFAEELNGRGNEGPIWIHPSHQEMYFTAPLRNDKNNPLPFHGIYRSTKTSNGWSHTEAFDHNSSDATYHCAHPSFDLISNRLYFVSDMEGGHGGKDIYYCERNQNGWGLPVNVGPEINTSGNEIFPFISADGTLYYSSDIGGNYDIYKSQTVKGIFQKRDTMPAPVNTSFNEYAFSISENNESGYFTSNRNDNQDDLFSYELSYPDFEHCPPAEEPSFCYLFEETEILPNDSMPMIFEWELGDGKTAGGLSTEYCYKDFGKYHVALNVYDSLTKARFARVSEVDIEIARSPYPFITAQDSVAPGTPFKLSAEGTDIEDMKPEKYFWNFGDGSHGTGYETTHPYKNSGKYTIQLGVISYPPDGQEIRRCASKDIMVGSVEEITAWIAEEEALASQEAIAPIESALQEDMIIIEKDSTKLLQYAPDSTLYFIEFKQSKERLNADDPFFNNIKFEITERYDSSTTSYKYSVGHTTEMPEMMRIYRDMMSNGYLESIIREQVDRDYDAQLIQQWWYMPDSLAASFNAHLNKFNDIRFDFGTYTINQASFDNLNYIAEIMNLDHNIKLKIKAYTDSIGTDSRNIQLAKKRAEAVKGYLMKSGVNAKRLIAEGYGEAMPVADNSNEEGRAQNRRVEFEIMVEDSQRKKP
jgi:outer membrane protein OmpA-like peptidoglycan-associated protein